MFKLLNHWAYKHLGSLTKDHLDESVYKISILTVLVKNWHLICHSVLTLRSDSCGIWVLET